MDNFKIFLLLFSAGLNLHLSNATKYSKPWQYNTRKANISPVDHKHCLCFPDGELPITQQLLDTQNNGLERVLIYLYKNDVTNEIKMYTPSAEKQKLIPDLPYESSDGLVSITPDNVYTLIYNNPNRIKVYNNRFETLNPAVSHSLPIGLNLGAIEHVLPTIDNVYLNPQNNSYGNGYELDGSVLTPNRQIKALISDPQQGSIDAYPQNINSNIFFPTEGNAYNLDPTQTNWMNNNMNYPYGLGQAVPKNTNSVTGYPQAFPSNSQGYPENTQSLTGYAQAFPTNTQATPENVQSSTGYPQAFPSYSQTTPENTQSSMSYPQEFPSNSQGVPENTQSSTRYPQAFPSNSQGIPENTQPLTGYAQAVPTNTQATTENIQSSTGYPQAFPSNSQGIPENTQPLTGYAQAVPTNTQATPENIQSSTGYPQAFPSNSQGIPENTQPLTGYAQAVPTNTQATTENIQSSTGYPQAFPSNSQSIPENTQPLTGYAQAVPTNTQAAPQNIQSSTGYPQAFPSNSQGIPENIQSSTGYPQGIPENTQFSMGYPKAFPSNTQASPESFQSLSGYGGHGFPSNSQGIPQNAQPLKGYPQASPSNSQNFLDYVQTAQILDKPQGYWDNSQALLDPLQAKPLTGELDQHVVYTFQTSQDQGSYSSAKDIKNLYSTQIVTFNAWFNQQMKRFQNINLPNDIKSIDGKFLRLLVLKTFSDNNIFISDDGIIMDSKGTFIDVTNLELRPLLLGETINPRILQNLHKQITLPKYLPYLEGILVTFVSPPQILGIIPLGKTYLLQTSRTRPSLSGVIVNRTKIFVNSYGNANSATYLAPTELYTVPVKAYAGSVDYNTYSSGTTEQAYGNLLSGAYSKTLATAHPYSIGNKAGDTDVKYGTSGPYITSTKLPIITNYVQTLPHVRRKLTDAKIEHHVEPPTKNRKRNKALPTESQGGGDVVKSEPLPNVNASDSTSRFPSPSLKGVMKSLLYLLDDLPNRRDLQNSSEETDIVEESESEKDGGSPNFRIIGGNAATGSGTPVSSKGRSGYTESI